MATSVKDNAAGKAGNSNVQTAAAQSFGTPQEKKQNPLRTTIASATCGDVQVKFESVEWLSKEDQTKYDPPIPSFVAYVDGFKNANGYRKEIPLSGDPEELDNLAKVLQGVAKFVRDTGVDISKSEYYKLEMETAYEKFALNGGSSKK